MSVRIAIAFPDGTSVPGGDSLPYTSLQYVLSESGIGVMDVEIPSNYVPDGITKDCRLYAFRSPYGSTEYLDGQAVWLVRRRERIFGDAEELTKLRAYHVNSLLLRRIIYAGAGSAGATKSGAADDLVKAYFSENFITAAAARAVSSLSVEGNSSRGASVVANFEWQPLFEAITSLCEASREAGTYIGFELQPAGTGFKLVTFAGQRGVDRRASSGRWIPFGRQYKNISRLVISEPWEDSATVAYSLGPGEGSLRPIASAQLSVDERGSPFGRFETVAGGSARDSLELVEMASAELESKRFRYELEAQVVDTATCIYGRDYNWGDRVTVEDDVGGLYDCVVDPVRISISGGGEDLDIRLTYRG